MIIAANVSSPFSSLQPIVRLVNAFSEPYNNAIATARTCYCTRVITSNDVQQDETARAQRDIIARSTYTAGHHTTLQHAAFQFIIENVSRQFVWSFLHAHPFYNSEQVSQRYVKVQPDRLLIPQLPAREAEFYQQTAAAQMLCYRELTEILIEPTAKAYFDIFQARQKQREQYLPAIRKKAQEVARYALPVATFTQLYHTVSGLTLHRYHRLSRMLDVPNETRIVINAMIDAVNEHDPLFFSYIEDPLELEQTHEYALLSSLGITTPNSNAHLFCKSFDADLGEFSSRLLDYQNHGEKLLAQAVRTTIGLNATQLSDSDAIAWVLSPKQNPYLGGALNLASIGKVTRSLMHPHYTFLKKLSHAADSQDQRHRMTPGSRPILSTQYRSGTPDVILPTLIANFDTAHDRFMQTMQQTWQAIDKLLDAGVTPEFALYLLPNAFPIRFIESGDLAAWQHKWSTRLCYNAQDEIWRATVDEVKQIREQHPTIGQYLGPPCATRQQTNVKPYCPEGSRYCGVKVWQQNLNDYNRVI
ncbi:MAG: FAD-dependent thymidylate synthase [Deltaproteobacteria bacterium]|nr:FAD-dependent thymidylate synthase [Deltaproteobacteria bacterium]